MKIIRGPGFDRVAFRFRQKLELSRDDIVHRADDRDPPLPDEAVERLALMAHPFNDPRHVAAGHGIDERFLLGRRSLLGTPAGDRVGRLLNVMYDVVEVLAAGDFGRRPGIANEIDNRGYGTAPGVPHNQDQLCPGHGTPILRAGQNLAAGDVAAMWTLKMSPSPGRRPTQRACGNRCN